MSWLSKGLKRAEEAIASVIPHQTAAERRAKADAVNTYYQQKQSAIEEQNKISAQRDIEQRRLQEKQIRSMRRRYRSAGFMEPMSDIGAQEKLG
jgi:nitrate/TMAO reductase-like tetraheme cytochrome c subunit